MKKQIEKFFLLFTVLFMLFPLTASADIGPKPSVYITFENMGDEICYCTLLSESFSTGPDSAYEGDIEAIDRETAFTYGLDFDIWEAFVKYEDSDGYYFLQWAHQCNESKAFSWGYYPPDPFKILLYYPETDTFVVSGIYERYAFDSYFTVDMKDMEISAAGTSKTLLTARQSYNYTEEVLSLIIRIILTVLIEIGIAFLFGFRQKKLLALITGINITTQIILNVLLNVINYHSGWLAFVFYYFRYEFYVLIIEAVLYCTLFNKVSKTAIPKWKAIIYALLGNIVSFVSGFFLSLWIPEIF